jgi:hypothetical protein
MYTVRSITFHLDHEMDSLHFILNGEDPIPFLKYSSQKKKRKEKKIHKKNTNMKDKGSYRLA